jgi:TolB-like protein
LLAAAVLVAAIVAWALRTAPPGPAGAATGGAPGTLSIAVLPFENVGGDSAQEYFVDGMTEEISGVLGKIPHLRVTGRRSAFAYKGRSATPEEIGRALGVTLLLEGRVRREGGQIRVTAELTDVASGSQRWNGKWTAELKDAFGVQDSIAQGIAAELRLALGGRALAVSRAGRTANPVAHDLYLRGRAHLLRSTEPELRRAVALFQEALAVDPAFAQAYAAIASAWAFMADGYVPAREAYPRMRDAARAALRLDSLLPEAHATHGFAVLATRDYAGGSRAMARAVALDPNSFEAALFYSNYLCLIGGRTEEGLAYSARALALEPLSVLASWNREVCFYSLRRYEDVIAQHRVTARLDSTFVYIDAFHAAALREMGSYAEAVSAYEEAQRHHGQPLFGLAITHARLGRRDEAQAIMRLLEERARRELVTPHALVLGYAGTGDADRALAWIRRALDAQSIPDILSLRTSPELDAIRGDPRFTALVQSLALP